MLPIFEQRIIPQSMAKSRLSELQVENFPIFYTFRLITPKKIRRNPFNRVLLFGDTVPIKAVGKIGIVDSLLDIE